MRTLHPRLLERWRRVRSALASVEEGVVFVSFSVCVCVCVCVCVWRSASGKVACVQVGLGVCMPVGEGIECVTERCAHSTGHINCLTYCMGNSWSWGIDR